MVRVLSSVVAALLTLLVATGCGGGDTTPTDGESSPSAASSSPTTSSSPSESSEAPSSVGADASTTPATGKRFDAGAFSVVVPDGWTGGPGVRSGVLSTATFASPDMTTVLDLTVTATPGSPTLEELAAIALKNQTDGGQRQPDRQVGGQQAFVISSDGEIGTSYEIGSVAVGGTRLGQVALTFAPASVSGVEPDPAAQQTLVDSILATVQWTP